MATSSPPRSQNATLTNISSWQAEPTQRGTWAIISTCLCTLLISVWSAIHVDVSPRRQKRAVLEKVRWFLVGLFAPEWLLYVAFTQLCWTWELSRCAKMDLPAGQLVPSPAPSERTGHKRKPSVWSMESEDASLVGTLVGQDEAETISSRTSYFVRQHAWTLSHGFYAAMGGFVLDSSPTPVFGTEDCLVVTPSMLLFLMAHAPDLIPDISQDHIQSLSKSNGLANLLVFAQLLYFLGSCIARPAQSLPFSLLELWTLSHTLAVLFVHIMWLKKPLDVAEPMPITGERAREFAAYFQMVGEPAVPRSVWIGAGGGSAETAHLEIVPADAAKDHADVQYAETEWIVLLPGQTIEVGAYVFAIRSTAPDRTARRVLGDAHRPWYVRERGPEGQVTLGRSDMERWRLAARAATRIGGFGLAHNTITYTQAGGLRTIDPVAVYGIRPVVLTGAVLAGVHTVCVLPYFLGWDAVFPTSVERRLWRVASVAAIALPSAFFLCIFAGFIILGTIGTNEAVPSMLRRIFMGAAMAVYCACLVLYTFAHGFLVVESFKQFSYLPSGVYVLPDFSVYVPHFS
ncbi:hypothetical protein PsYK624_126130 [Phanerochaete sordida]|uniref:Uncharacterized protein n=1 Tax=Phanerochaete sordida TaxID=48140 RepID=A0A9P3LID1_9APHY|nr:hypothetical protein PsYK624_126130 [Phanerochaete sordida]